MTGLSWASNRNEDKAAAAKSLREAAAKSEVIDLWIGGQPAVRLLAYVAERLELADEVKP